MDEFFTKKIGPEWQKRVIHLMCVMQEQGVEKYTTRMNVLVPIHVTPAPVVESITRKLHLCIQRTIDAVIKLTHCLIIESWMPSDSI